VLLYSIIFIFSSRRRHTSFSRDWSSDVSLPICSVLLQDVDTNGGVRLRRFWVRRVRRLWPASLAALAGIALYGATVADASQANRSAERRVGTEGLRPCGCYTNNTIHKPD